MRNAPRSVVGRGEGERGVALVSIVITCFNYGRFLGEAIESALGQTHDPVEVVVVDDGSTDDSRDVARRYPVKLVEQANRGVCAARNRGARETRGGHLMFLDADDLLEPTYVERCLAPLAHAPPRVAYAYTQVRMFGLEDRVEISAPFSPARLIQGNMVNASALLRRAPFEHVGGFAENWRLRHEDRELWLRLLAHGYEGVFVPEPLLRYRRHGVTRNTMTAREMAEIDAALRVRFPRLHRRQLALHPIESWRAWRRERRRG